MFLHELFEAADTPDVLFHYTSIYSLRSMLKSGQIHLTTDMGSKSELDHRKGDKHFYLSTARNRHAHYTTGHLYKEGVVINLDRDWIKARYSTKSVDYWGSDYASDEQEERIYSNKPDMSIKAIASVHILLEERTSGEDPLTNNSVLECVLMCRRNGIPVFVYDKRSNMLAQRNPINIGEFFKNRDLRVKEKPYPSRKRSDFLAVWRELYYKKNYDDLSDGARRRTYPSFIHYDFKTQMQADIHNARSSNRDAILKTMKMFKDGGFKSVEDFREFVQQKWARN